MISGGIFGPKLSGKSTLAKSLSREYWLEKGIRSLVLDPHQDDDWGNQAWVTSDEKLFWERVWATKNSLIVVEEAAATIRRDRALTPVFTRLRHNHHRLLIVGHSGMDLLPSMRQQLDTIFLFSQPQPAAEVWDQTFRTEKYGQLLEASSLGQFEFLRARLYKAPVKMKLTGVRNRLNPTAR